MQSNIYSEDPLFSYWNEFDGGGPNPYPILPQMPSQPTIGTQYENFNLLPPPPVGLACPAGLMDPAACPNPLMGPVPRAYVRFPPTLALAQCGPQPQQLSGISLPSPPFTFQPHPPQQQYPIVAPPPSGPLSAENLERNHLNDMGQMEEVVVKNGQVFHISFLDEPAESGASAIPRPNSGDTESEESQSRDWINYDELPLLQNVCGGETENGTYKCGICGKELKSALNLYVHEQTHKTTRLDCKICGKRFNRIGKLEHHVSKHHPDESNAACSKSSPSGTPVLSDFSNYCVECEEFFGSSDELQNHMEVNHRLIDDSQCPKNALKKSVGCPYCNESFEWPCLLKTHMTKHTGEKPFICERCNVSFRFVQSFYRHNRRVHGREK
ncbi:zinc finger protein 60-like [Wyeomyia smithii]|uniref:zinc finger protein 60-like n=1 Tax=Wyeomyia smithii TaxID=174621 RepID=UPI002467AF4A|nr:zinc finger protein 60-like [Wyeomyia smithii]